MLEPIQGGDHASVIRVQGIECLILPGALGQCSGLTAVDVEIIAPISDGELVVELPVGVFGLVAQVIPNISGKGEHGEPLAIYGFHYS